MAKGLQVKPDPFVSLFAPIVLGLAAVVAAVAVLAILSFAGVL